MDTLGQVFKSSSVCMHATHLLRSVAIQPILELKIQRMQLKVSLRIDIALS
jgi:hypothetical protein